MIILVAAHRATGTVKDNALDAGRLRRLKNIDGADHRRRIDLRPVGQSLGLSGQMQYHVDALEGWFDRFGVVDIRLQTRNVFDTAAI